MTKIERAAREAGSWAIRATPLAALWLILGFVKSGRMRESAGDTAVSDGWGVVILGGIGIVAAVFAGAFVLRLAGMRAPDELPVTHQHRMANRQRYLMTIMWIGLAVTALMFLFGGMRQ